MRWCWTWVRAADDVLLSARQVGPAGRAYGLDMTDDMLALAEDNKARAGVDNVDFLRGDIEDIPLPDESVDVIISNCVINMSADKHRVFAEAFRVLRPGGRFAVSDMVLRGTLPAEVADLVAAWTGCVAGALEESDYRAKLAAAGFVDIDLQPTREFDAADAHVFLADQGLDADRLRRRSPGTCSAPSSAPGDPEPAPPGCSVGGRGVFEPVAGAGVGTLASSDERSERFMLRA